MDRAATPLMNILIGRRPFGPRLRTGRTGVSCPAGSGAALPSLPDPTATYLPSDLRIGRGSRHPNTYAPDPGVAPAQTFCRLISLANALSSQGAVADSQPVRPIAQAGLAGGKPARADAGDPPVTGIRRAFTVH